MADFNPIEDIKIDPIEDDIVDDGQQRDDFANNKQETSFNKLPNASSNKLASEVLREIQEDFYKYIEKLGFKVNKDAPLSRKVIFGIDYNKNLLAKYRNENGELVKIQLTNSRYPYASFCH